MSEFFWLNRMSCHMTKPTKWPKHPVKTQISLGICTVWSESSLSAWRNLGSLATQWVHSKDWLDWADTQTDWSLHWVHVSFCWFCHVAAHMYSRGRETAPPGGGEKTTRRKRERGTKAKEGTKGEKEGRRAAEKNRKRKTEEERRGWEKEEIRNSATKTRGTVNLFNFGSYLFLWYSPQKC